MEDFAKKYSQVGTGNSIFSSMPKADSFENFFEYEQALLDWKTNVEGYRTSYLFTLKSLGTFEVTKCDGKTLLSS